MDCNEFLARYSEYDDSLVSPEETDRFRVHMAACEDCSRYDRVLRKGRMLARQLSGPEPSEDFQRKLQLRLWTETRRSVDRARRASRLAAGLAGVTVVASAAAAVSMMDSAPGDRRIAESAPARSAQVAPAPQPAAAPGAFAGGTGDADSRLPAVSPLPPRPWAVERVARPIAASYSPLVTGPPAYRVRTPELDGSFTLRRTLD